MIKFTHAKTFFRGVDGDFNLCLFPKQLHVSKSSTVADHGASYALRDPNESAYQSPCDHEDTDECDRCEMLGYCFKKLRLVQRVSPYLKGQKTSLLPR